MTPRGLLTTIGASALGIGVVLGSAGAIPRVFAQETTPATELPTQQQQQQQQEIDFDAERAQAYDSFVAALASELGADEAAVDAAIRTALRQQVDAREAAGDLDTEQAAALRAVIDVSEAPLFSGFGGPGGMHGFRGGAHHGPRGGLEGHGPRGGLGGTFGPLPDSDMPPATLPSADDASDQSAPAPRSQDESPVL